MNDRTHRDEHPASPAPVLALAASRATMEGLDDGDWQPMEVDGRELGEVHWLLAPGPGPGLAVGFWRCGEDVVYRYAFETDELFYVFEGSQEVVFDDGGERVAVGPGELGAFVANRPATVTLRAPFSEFFVIRT